MELGTSDSKTVILAEIQACKIIAKHAALDIHYYKDFMTPSVFDITCIQCLVGWIQIGQIWAIIDCSGPLARAYYEPEAQ